MNDSTFYILAVTFAFLICLSIFATSYYNLILVTQKYDEVTTQINLQNQVYVNSIQTKGYTVHSAYFNSPAVTISVNSFQELYQKATELNTTDIYSVTIHRDVANSLHSIASYYVIDSTASYAWQYIPSYEVIK
jgi:hypothetical protein